MTAVHMGFSSVFRKSSAPDWSVLHYGVPLLYPHLLLRVGSMEF